MEPPSPVFVVILEKVDVPSSAAACANEFRPIGYVEEPSVLRTDDDGVVTLTLNRPAIQRAFFGMLAALQKALEASLPIRPAQ